MNKDLFNQIPVDGRPVASKLDSVADTMQPSPIFQWELETQLLQAYKSKTERHQPGWFVKALVPVGWALVAVSALFLLNWTLRSISPGSSPAAILTAAPEIAFETNVRQGNICAGPLAVGHGFDVFLTNADKTDLIPLDPDKAIGELRSFAWSPDGERLALVVNTMGHGNIYFTNPNGEQIGYLLSSSELGYVIDAAWSRDGKQLLTWSGQNNTIVYLLSTDGTAHFERQLDIHILGTPRFAPNGESIVFHGADSTSAGLFEVQLDATQSRLISAQVEDGSSFEFSPDGTRLAYVDTDRDDGVALLVAQDLETRAILSLPGSLPIPRGLGSSLPEVANLSWSQDGRFLVFEFGRSANDRAIYFAHADGTGLVKIADGGHAPAISADGRCLAYVSGTQVFLLDLRGVSATSVSSTPIRRAGLPAGRSIADFRLDRLQWKP